MLVLVEGGRRGGLMVSTLNSGLRQSKFKTWPETLHCVHGQDTWLSQCLSPPRCINGYYQGGVEIFLLASCYRNWDKFWCYELMKNISVPLLQVQGTIIIQILNFDPFQQTLNWSPNSLWTICSPLLTTEWQKDSNVFCIIWGSGAWMWMTDVLKDSLVVFNVKQLTIQQHFMYMLIIAGQTRSI